MTPLRFLTWLRAELRRAGIRFLLTSGQACVVYGIQQTTKDSDWIIVPDDIEKLHGLLADWDKAGAYRARYRSICGAPLERAYLGHGWTSHLAVVEVAKGVEHHVDIFGKPPRVEHWESDRDDAEIASRHMVGQMKKTDRDKDWPIVFSLGRQMLERGDWRGLLHLQDAEALVDSWPHVPAGERSELVRQRPLLAMIDQSPDRLRRAIAIERTVWIAINQARYTCYQRPWKEFYRRWRREPDMRWPLTAGFERQHEVLVAACAEHQLPVHPFDEQARQAAYLQGLQDAAEIMAATAADLDEIVPSIDIMLP
jgi:hypothetical protein